MTDVPKRNIGTNKLFMMQKLKPCDHIDIRKYVTWFELENKRLRKINDDLMELHKGGD